MIISSSTETCSLVSNGVVSTFVNSVASSLYCNVPEVSLIFKICSIRRSVSISIETPIMLIAFLIKSLISSCSELVNLV